MKKSRFEALYFQDLAGLPRQCNNCGIIAHYEVRGRKPVMVRCPECGVEFEVQKYRRGERPIAVFVGKEDR